MWASIGLDGDLLLQVQEGTRVQKPSIDNTDHKFRDMKNYESDSDNTLQDRMNEASQRLELLKPTDREIQSIVPKRNLSKKDIKKEITDTKPNKKNGMKLLLLLVIVIIVISSCVFVSRKMKEYINSDESTFVAQQRKGKLELYQGQKFKKMKEEPSENGNNISIQDTK